MALLLALLACDSAADAHGIEVSPVGLLEADYRLQGHDVEGYDGFALSRARAGIVAVPFAWLELHLAGEWAREKVALLDAYAQVNVAGQLAILAGYSRNSLFLTGRDELDPYFAIPERSITVQALWPGLDLGVEAHWFPRAPIEVWLRVENGGTSVVSNDNSPPALTARADLVLGRANARATGTEDFGLRVGGGGYLDWAPDRVGVSAATQTGFVFYRSASVSGFRSILEGHALVQCGPVDVTFEAGVAREERSRSVAGDPRTPRQVLSPVESVGAAFTISWLITGERRLSHHWTTPRHPLGPGWGWGAWEIAARFETMLLDVGARDVRPGGVTSGSAALHWWVNDYAALALGAYVNRYASAPLEEPGTTLSWTVLLRATLRAE